jgi:polysaccharide export outer membrane protein
MYLPKTLGKRILVVAGIMLLGVWAVAAYAQDGSAQGSDSNTASKPVIPADSGTGSSNNVAKATSLPSTDTPPARVSAIGGTSAIKADSYVIGVGDGLLVSVWKEPELTKNVPVRPDGMITLPLIGEMKAVGLTPNQLQDQITASLQKVMSDPQVVVVVEAVNSLSFNIMGNVFKPGFFPLVRPLTILDAIALSGGFRDFAKEKKIYILRTDAAGKQEKLHFNYKQVIKGQNIAQNVMVQPGDTIVVP